MICSLVVTDNIRSRKGEKTDGEGSFRVLVYQDLNHLHTTSLVILKGIPSEKRRHIEYVRMRKSESLYDDGNEQ